MEQRIVLDIEALSHAYTPEIRVLHELDVHIARGQIVSLVGPSGCGKSTLLNCILGTLTPSQGHVATHRLSEGDRTEHVVRGPGRDRGIVYQRYALFPHLTALENVALGPKLDETTYPSRLFGGYRFSKLRKQHREEAAWFLERVGLKAAMHKYPNELSGGMQQRVAIAQAMIMKPEILLLDEPFGALDEATREDLQLMLLGFYEENVQALQKGEVPPHTILIVTHELNEAIYVGDRVIGLSQYWNWKEHGHDRPPGATIVYDKPAPVYHAEHVKEYELFVAQREEIRRVVFEPAPPTVRGEHVTFWKEVEAGNYHGVLAH